MRKLLFYILVFMVPAAFAADFDIKTKLNKEGQTLFFLQAGAFSKESNAKQWLQTLTGHTKESIEVIKGKNALYIVQIGPLKDYPTTRALKKQLRQVFNEGSTSQASPTEPEKNKAPTTGANITTHAEEGRIWNLRNADIRAVIAEVSRVTGKNFIIDPRVQGKVSIVSSTAINKKELYQAFLSMLQVSGYSAIPNGEVTKIVPNIDAKTLSPNLLSRLKSPPRGDEMIVEVIPVKYVPSEQLVPVLRPLMPQWSQVSAYGPSNMLILSGRASNIKRLVNIIRQVDSSSANDIDIVQLRHALAMDVANTLKDLVKAPKGGGMQAQTMIAADDRSNSILVSGGKTERIRLRLLIARLDRENGENSSANTKVIYLNYLRAEDLVPILAGIAQANFSGTIGTTIGTITRPPLDSTNPASNFANGSSSSQTETNTETQSQTSSDSKALSNTKGSDTQTEGSTKPSIQIIAEPNTNSIIINAPYTIITILNKVISQLDIRPAQLLIEALVAEVNQSDINDLGIEWGSDRQTGDPNSFRPGFAIINSQTKIDDFQAQIYALAREKKANILSTPSVVVLDNRQAKILVGRQVSVATTSYPNNAGGTTTASPFTTFDRVNVALHLYVRPQITRGRGIQMQIDQGNDTLDPASILSANDQPVFNISSIVTSVHVESGDVVVLGGLSQDSLSNDDNRLPILGDIPGIGKLFQRNVLNREKKVLMVFIKPLILRNERDAIQVSNSKYNQVRTEQLDFIREQDQYNPDNSDGLLPPLHSANLPKPFTHPTLKPGIKMQPLPKSSLNQHGTK